MGGLVSSYYALNLAPKDLILDVITLGSPLMGTMMAEIGIGKCADEMRRDSKFILDLNKKMQNCKNVTFYNLASQIDHLIIPFDSALPKNQPQRQCLIKDVGHNTLLFSKNVNLQICKWLENIS